MFCYSPFTEVWRCFDQQPSCPRKLTGGVDGIAGINIIAYEPAFGIIGDPAKKDPKTRQFLGRFRNTYFVSLAGVASVPLYFHVTLAITLQINQSINLSIYLSICLSNLSIYLFIYLFIYRCIDVIIYLSIYPSMHPSIYLSTYLPVYTYLYLSNPI